jgi:hypothetical protein
MAGNPENMVRSDMGFFDRLANGNFKTTPDGRRLFFPWGMLGSGYAIASEQDYRRLHRQIKGYLIVCIVLGFITPSLFGGYVAFVVILALLLGFYRLWMWRLLPRLNHSDERLSPRESMAASAHVYSSRVLWLLAIAALACVGGGIWMLVVDPSFVADSSDRLDPSDRLIVLASTILTGLCGAIIARMLWLRRRNAGDGAGPNPPNG